MNAIQGQSTEPHRGHAFKEQAELELADGHLIRYWSDRFRCTPIELLAVVGRVGRSISLVKAEVERRRGRT